MKLNIGKKVMMKLNEVKLEGIIPSDFAEKNYLPYENVTAQIVEWEAQGKVTCIERKITPYVSKYALTKYIQK